MTWGLKSYEEALKVLEGSDHPEVRPLNDRAWSTRFCPTRTPVGYTNDEIIRRSTRSSQSSTRHWSVFYGT